VQFIPTQIKFLATPLAVLSRLYRYLIYRLLYADDLLLIAPSETMLENLLHKCGPELHWIDMAINNTRKVAAFALAFVPELPVMF